MIVKTKRRRRVKRNKSRTKRGGGVFDFFTKKYDKKDESEKAKTLINKSDEKDVTGKGLLETSATEAASVAATSSFVAALSNAGYISLTTLGATGIGIPLAGAIAGSLLVINKIMWFFLDNKRLAPVLYDSMSILVNTQNLYDLIEMSHTKIHEKQQNNSTDYIKYDIDESILSHILTKINNITKYLLKLAPNKAIRILHADDTIKMSNNMKSIVDDEIKLRKSMFMSKVDMAQRVLNRTFSSNLIISEIISSLTLINGFVAILKSQYDFFMDYNKRHMTEEEWKEVMNAIEKDPSFDKFMSKKGVSEILVESRDMVEKNSDKIKDNETIVVNTNENNTNENDPINI
jgi:hypothetical protein